ncbi:MAG: peptidoglycan editing factor PgeF [Clostridiales bacterium]|nr:peptidoglycan editing factor PgeF [Clostridiales bacterium]
MTDGGTLPLLKFPLLEDSGIVRHGFTTRLGGVSEGIFASLNLSFTRGDNPDHVTENYRRVADALGAEAEKIVCSDQTHTTHVRVVTEADAGKGVTIPKDYTDVDGLITNVPGLTLATFFADCVPLYFVDPVHCAIGLSHSEWRGTVARMGQKTLQAMTEQYGTRPEDVLCAIGPSICQDCYEVSADVAEVFAREFSGHEAEILLPESKHINNTNTCRGKNSAHEISENEKYLLDLWKANEIVLLDAGVPQEHISVTDICTCCNPDLLFSHRASHGKRENLGAFLALCDQ